MMRRLGIAQALLNEPRLLVLDEPTAGLDPSERIRFRELLASLSGERLVVLSTHIISDVEAMATEFVILRRGRVNWAGTPEGLLADAEGQVWSLAVETAEFERLRGQHRVSAAMRRSDGVQVRLIAPSCPHPRALSVSPTLEEDAYLLYIGDDAKGEEVA